MIFADLVSSLTFLISSICERFSALFGSEISESRASVNRKFILRYFCCIYTSKSSKFSVKCSQKHLYKTTAFARFPNSRVDVLVSFLQENDFDISEDR